MNRLERARNQFAAANGWKVGKFFSLDQLIRNKKNTGSSNSPRALGLRDSRMADHPEFFRLNGYPVALLGHSYRGGGAGYIDGMKEMAARFAGQLVLHIPPAGTAASWYYPGGALPMLLTRPDVTKIVWPTEQEMTAMAAAYGDECSRQTTRAHRAEGL
jgi:hypothetical protein